MSVIQVNFKAVKDSANLDLLRSFAVLCVFVDHLAVRVTATPAVSLGRLGVLLFFVHTSYVLLLSLQRSGENWWSFQIRRIFRVYPLAIVACVAYVVLKVPVLVEGNFQYVVVSARDFVANIFLIQNITGSQSVPVVLWSLPFEMQMYLVIPVVFGICIRFGRAGSIWLYSASVFTIIAMVVIGLPTGLLIFVPCFLAGALLFTSSTKQSIHWLLMPAFLISLSAISLTGVLRNPLSQWICCLALALIFPYFLEVNNARIRAASKVIAKYSFGIYLFHWAALQWSAMLTANPVLLAISATAITALLSFIAYRFIEEPMIETGKRLSISRGRRFEWFQTTGSPNQGRT